jgi:ATP/maltotriose-dependent transcriptional regulator MalT
MSAGWAGRTEEAERLLRVAESSLSPVPDTPEARALAGTMAYVRGRMAGMCGDLARAVELAHLARGLAPASDTSMQVSIANMLGYAHFMRGDAEQATEVLGDAMRLARTGTSCNHSVSTLCLLARVRRVQGRLRGAADLYREARQMIEEQGERQLNIAPSHPCRAAYCTVSF